MDTKALNNIHSKTRCLCNVNIFHFSGSVRKNKQIQVTTKKRNIFRKTCKDCGINQNTTDFPDTNGMN